MKDDILQTLRKQVRAGYPAGELKNELLAKGYSPEEIEELFNNVAGSSKETADNRSLFNDKGSIVRLIGISLIILGIAMVSARVFYTDVGYLSIVTGIMLLLPGVFRFVGNEFRRK